MNPYLKRMFQGSVLLLILSLLSLGWVTQWVAADLDKETILATSEGIVELENIHSTNLIISAKSIDSKVQIQLRASDLEKITNRLPLTLVELKTEWGSCILPVNFMDYTAWSNKHEVNLSELLLQITIERIEDAGQINLLQTMLGGAELVSPLIRITITLVANGKNIELADYNGKYISNSFSLFEEKDSADLTAIGMDAASGNLSFAPALFQMWGNQTMATIKTPHNGIYGVVRVQRSFTDLGERLEKQDIELLASKLVIQGATAKRFKPDAILTRAEAISMLVRALGLKDTTYPETSLTDSIDNAWYAGAVWTATKAGIIRGYTNGTLWPQQSITREQLAVMLANALRFTNFTVNVRERADLLLVDFADSASISSWAISGVEQVVDTQIMPGSSRTKFAPKAYITRAEAAGIIKRFMQFIHFID